MAASRVGISHGRVCDGFDVDVAVSNNQARTMSDFSVGEGRYISRRSLRRLTGLAPILDVLYSPQLDTEIVAAA
jgi:hypothetical protein